MNDSEAHAHELVNKHFDNLKNELELYFKNSSNQVIQEKKALYEPQLNKLESQLKAEQDHFTQMEMDTGKNTTELARKEGILNKMLLKSARLHAKVRNNNLSSRAFHSWIESGTSKGILSRTYKSIYIDQAPKRIFFRKWFKKMLEKREIGYLNEIKQKFEKEAKTKAIESNKQISQLEAELAGARAELEMKQKNFRDMQQKLKKSFMRGVVNLNLEAMDVFNGSQYANLVEEVENNEQIIENNEPVDEGDEEFFIEEEPQISIIRHK